ncbi:uncharacterized protein LOC6533009 [Drosophila yakuba]|nr:uncharacterized protein LOC6533009 [Drosophila yakuba]
MAMDGDENGQMELKLELELLVELKLEVEVDVELEIRDGHGYLGEPGRTMEQQLNF